MPTMLIRHAFLFILEPFFFSIVIPGYACKTKTKKSCTDSPPANLVYLLLLKKLNSICEN